MLMLQRIDCPILGAKSASTLAEPPALLDLAWRRAGHGRWIAGRTEQGDCLLRRFPNATAKAGLSVRDRIIEWDLSAAAQMPDLAKRIVRWEADVRQDLAHHARVAATTSRASAMSAWARRACPGDSRRAPASPSAKAAFDR
jgi:hypothetical protein